MLLSFQDVYLPRDELLSLLDGPLAGRLITWNV